MAGSPGRWGSRRRAARRWPASGRGRAGRPVQRWRPLLVGATGARVVSGDVLAAYVAAGGPRKIGFPIADQGPVTGGAAAAFQDGSIYWSAGTGAHVVRGQIGRPGGVVAGSPGRWGSRRRTARRWPASGARPGGSALQRWRPLLVQCHGCSGGVGDVLAAFVAAGTGEKIGFPIADQGPVTEVRRRHSRTAPSTVGRHRRHLVRGQIRAAWWGRGGITGPLGFPTASGASVAGLGSAAGQVGRFSGGALYWSSATGARVVSGDVLAAFVAAGRTGEDRLPDRRPGAGDRGCGGGVPGRLHLLVGRHRRPPGARAGPVGVLGVRLRHRAARVPDPRARLRRPAAGRPAASRPSSAGRSTSPSGPSSSRQSTPSTARRAARRPAMAGRRRTRMP